MVRFIWAYARLEFWSHKGTIISAHYKVFSQEKIRPYQILLNLRIRFAGST